MGSLGGGSGKSLFPQISEHLLLASVLDMSSGQQREDITLHLTEVEQSPRLLAPSQTANRAALSYRAIQRLVQAKQFPEPVRLSAGRIAFIESEVNAWIAARPRVSEAA